MANKKNVEANKKNTEIKNKKSNELEQKKPTKKKKLRLHSHLKVNIPLFQSLMMILPSLAKHTAAEDVDNSGDNADQVAANNVTAKDSSDHHGKMDSSAVTHQEAQTSDSDVNSTLSASHAPHGSSSHLVPSHHLSTLSHPQVHYIPSVSMPTISSGSNGQPTHSNAPTTTALPVTFMPEVIKGTYGELHVDANGQYTFVLNPKSPQYILLNQHQQGTDHFLLHLSNGSSVIVQVPVTGKQDTPSISGDLTGVVTEDHNIDSQGLLHANGKIDVIDPDQNESSVAPEVISGKYGSLTIDADGHWQYQVNNSLSNVQALTAATSLHESFTIHTKDGTPQTIDMTIGGNDDNAVITGVDAGVVTEESHLQTSGTLTVTDVDTGEAHFSNTDVVGTLGTLHLKDNGAWTYDLDNTNPKVQALGQGATATDTITVQSADGTPHKVTITVNGTNDKAVIAGTDSGAVTEESQLQTSGTLTVTDVDTGEVHFSNTDVAGNLGTLHLTDSGAWTYVLDNTDPTVQALGKGSTATDTITVHSADGTPHQVTITVNGTNDKAVIAGTDSGVVTEESQLTTSGTLTVTDIDTGEAHFSNTDVVGTLGTLHLKDNGTWTYDLDNTNPKVQALGHGSNATDTITVQSSDGTTHQVSITVNGTNDKAVIAGTDSGAVTEESQLQTSGTLTVTDVDTGEAHFSNTDVVGTLGTLHLKDNGAWTYDLDNTNPTVQALGQGKNATDTITVQSADGTTHQVSITVNGTNDKAVIAGTDSGTVTEESQLQTSGTLTLTDVDTGEAHFSNSDVQGTLGTLHLTDSGTWTYDLDNTNPKVQALGHGSNATDTITVQSADGTTHQVSITVNGTNDKAVIAGTDSGAVTEESQLQTSGTLTLTDVDTGEAHFSNTDIKGSLGTLHLTDSGAWTYDLDNSNPAVQALAKGQHAKDIITVHSTDGTPHQVAITVNGTNDAAQITGTTTGAVTEDRIYGMQWLVVNSHMHVTDTDAGEAHFDPVLHAQNNAGIGYISTLGASVVIAPDGDWHYQLDNNIQQVQSLGQGQSYIDKVTVHTADGTTQELQITITGTNDAPTVTGSRVLPAGTEDQTLRITQTQLLAGATDIDKNDSGTLHVDAVTADHGTVTHNADGSFTFHPDQDYNGQVKFTYDIKDAHGGSVQATASSTLAAAGDAATISGVDTGDVHEGHTFTAPDGSITGGYVDDRSPDHQHGNIGKLWNDEIHTDGHLSIVDADAGESYAQTGTYYGTHGRVILQTNGDWTYYASIGQDATGRAIDHLGKGESLTDTVTVKSADGTTHDIVVTIHGDNDRPYCSSEVQLNSGKEDLAQTITASELLANTIDVDTNDTGKLMIANLHADHGSIQDNKDGTYTFTPTKDYNGQVHFTYDVQDAHGGVTHTGATASLSAVGDTAIIGGQDTFTVQEDHNLTLNSGNTIIYNGQLTITDADAGEDHFDGNLHQNQQTGTWDTGYTTQEGGKLILQSNGSYRYEIDNSLAKIQSLGSSETLIDTVTVRSADGTPHQIQVTIQGDNDAPVVSSAVTLAAGTEDTDVVLHASDLLANATDIDHDDAGKLSVANLIADHGTITDNHDGTFTFHPTQDYNGKVSFTYDVHDAHGGSVATSASITLAPTRDSAVITGTDTGTIIEDHNVGHSSVHPVAASGLLNVTDPDAGQDHFQVNRFGEQAIHDPFGGFLRITPSGAWGYEVANSRLQSLAEGEVEKVVYRVYSADHTAHDITITVTGTNDQPTITATTLAHGTEDTHYQMQASQFGFTDIDTGDTLHSIAITELPPATQGKFVLDGHDITAGQQILTADISKLQFVPAQDFNGDVQFKYTVNDGHTDSTEATNTLHIDAVGDKAVIAGQDTGSLDEFGSHGSAYSDITDRSPDYHHSGSSNLFNQILSVTGDLTITDPDNNEAQFLSPAHQIRGQFGLLSISEQGHWVYQVSAGTSAAGRAIDKLGAGEKLTDTITIHSKDGTPHDIVITIHGDNDRPYCSSEVILNAGTEDTRQTLTTAQLLANTVDVDKNDAGLLSIENLHADHGSILNNADGTFTFTPEKDYNGDVHFSYDVKDAHGGVTHTGASTTLAAVDDKTMVSGVDHGVATEDVATHMLTHVNIMDAVDWQALQITDVDSPNTQVTVEFAGKQYTWNIDSGLDVTTPYGKFLFRTIASGAHKGEHSWSYIGDNNNVHVQELKQGESLTESIKLIATDGTEFPITVKVNGTEDGVVIDSKSELGHVVENAQTGASVSGNVVAHDVDLHDTVSWTQTPTAGISGQYGTFHLSADGQWHYDVDQSKATKLGDGTEYWEHFTVEAVSTDGSHVSKSVSVVVHGDNDLPTVSGEVTLPSGKEDTSIHITQAELIANATDVDTNDRGWLHVENLTADHGSLVSNSDGSFTFNPDPNYNGTVHFTYDVADRHGGIAHTGASTTLAAVNDAAVITGTGGHLLEEDNLYYGYTIKTNGQFHVVDPDGPSQSKFPDGLHHHTGSLGGTLQLYGNGNYFYHIENSAVNHLAKGQEARETFTIHSVDGTPHQVEFVIEGTNDAPFVHGDVTLSPGTEDTTVTLHASDLLAQAGDYDDGETAQLSVHNLSADHGTVTDNKDGTYTFKPDANYNGTVHFTYYVQDPQGATVATSASMALASVADTPVLSVDITDTSDNTLNASESGAAAISGSLDPSVASTLDRIEITDGTTTVTVDKANIAVATDGTYKTTADLTSLKDGALTVAAHATSHDGTTATATDTIIKDTQVSVPTITFENAGADNLYSKAEIARGQANTITATVTPPGDAKIGEHLVVNGRDHILDAHTLQHGIQIEVHPGSNVQATMTDEHGNTAGSQGFAASAIPEPIIVRPPSGSHQVSGTLGVPPLLPSLTPVPTAQSGWRIHLPNGQYVTSHHGQYGTLTIDPQTGHLHYQEQAQVHTGPHGSASGIGQHEDKFEVALQGTNQDEVVAHVNIQILSHGPGHSGKLTVGTEVVDMTITPVVHTSHPAPPPPPPEPNDDPDIALQADFTVMQSDDTYLDLTQHAHQEPDQKTSHHGAAAYLDALGIKPDATSTTVHDQPADMDIVLSQVDQPDAATHDQVHLDMSDALEHHDAANNHNQDEEHHHHNDVDGLPDIDPNS
ncbi:VCBS domain-containing protein [Vibrio barjaei]|uniref:VCBS domain-containing protein n=19 Tax=Vibrio TaxID=662 RepID=UPI00228369C8|nr:VCBS domain-containing protein [Vibrio barjaei]MCY9872199.1 VCBS domain-containing protein [Vibrio barjaei]